MFVVALADVIDPHCMLLLMSPVGHKCLKLVVESYIEYESCHEIGTLEHIFSSMGLIESMMGLRPRQGNLRLVFRLFSLMLGLPSIQLK